MMAAPVLANAAAVRVYDADDYVQSGDTALLLQLDGIRNAGVAAAHQESPATRTDLSGNLTLSKTGDAGFSGSTWTPDGSSYFTTSSDAVKEALANKAFTLEMVISHTTPATPRYEYWLNIGDSSGSKRELVVELRSKDGEIENPLIHAVEYRESAFATRSLISQDSDKTKWDERQYIAIVCDENGATTYCNGTNKVHTTVGGAVTPTSSAITIGAAWNQTYPLLSGAEICAVRMTSRALTEEERIRNYDVDRQRFFTVDAATIGRGNDIANVIVATDVEGAEGTEECGKWYVAEETHTFTAPVSRIVGKTVYNCTGYKIETWDGETWKTPVSHDGERTYTASASEKVRLTWLWAQMGTVRAARDYGVGDYVQQDLVAHFDGICNVGADAAHDPNATGWSNLVAGASHATFNQAAEGYEGEWKNDGYEFKGATQTGFAQLDSEISLGSSYAVQFVTTVDYSVQSVGTKWYPTLFNDSGNGYSVYFRNDVAATPNPNLALMAPGASTGNRPYIANWKGEYCTAMIDGTKMYIFDGTTIPASNAGLSGGYATCTSKELSSRFCFGGAQTVYNKGVKGVIHSVRMYSRQLTEEELEQNRAVDAVRFHPNVTVVNSAVGETGTVGESSVPGGAYNLDSGIWTITAPCVSVEGKIYQPQLLVETFNMTTGGWTANTTKPIRADSYTVDKNELGDSRIRLTWTWVAPKGLIILFR